MALTSKYLFVIVCAVQFCIILLLISQQSTKQYVWTIHIYPLYPINLWLFWTLFTLHTSYSMRIWRKWRIALSSRWLFSAFQSFYDTNAYHSTAIRIEKYLQRGNCCSSVGSATPFGIPVRWCCLYSHVTLTQMVPKKIYGNATVFFV